MYGVLVCPRCKRAKGVDLKQKTTTCVCGFEIRVPSARIYARAETARTLAPLVGQVSAELAGGTAAYGRDTVPIRRRRPQDPHARIVAIASKPSDRASRIRIAAVELSRELEMFSMEDWRRVLAGLGMERPDQALEILVRENFVMEPKEGFYRAVSLNP